MKTIEEQIKGRYQQHTIKLIVHLVLIISVIICMFNHKDFIGNDADGGIILIFELIILFIINKSFRIIRGDIILKENYFVRLILVLAIAIFFCMFLIEASIMLYEVFRSNNHKFLFSIHLIIQHYFLILSLREFIKLSRNELYRHFVDIVVYSVILAIDIISIGAYALKSTGIYGEISFSYFDVLKVGLDFALGKYEIETYIIFVFIYVLATRSLNNLLENCKSKVYVKGIK